jgi:hypothetical protein
MRQVALKTEQAELVQQRALTLQSEMEERAKQVVEKERKLEMLIAGSRGLLPFFFFVPNRYWYSFFVVSDSHSMCFFCLDKPRCYAIKECFHVISCESCLSSLESHGSCPVCRSAIVGFQRVFV